MRPFHALNALLRKSADPVAAPHEAPASPETPVAETRGTGSEIVDVLEADVLKAIGAVSQAINNASGEVGAARGDIGHIKALMSELAEAGRGAAAQTMGLASSTEELAATSGEITGAMDLANARVAEAVACARDANALIADLARASEEIVGIVDTIAAVARQTNLLALNATIEAARAGAAGRGFAVVAGEVKALSVETGNAANDIRQRITRLRDSAGSSIAAVERVMAVIDEVQPVFGTVRTAVDEQNASIAELAQRATEASSFAEEVSGKAHQVDAAAEDASNRVASAGQAAQTAETLAGSLAQRFVAVVRQSELGDRRRYDRLPVELDVRVRGIPQPSRTVDISRGGLLLGRLGDSAPRVGAVLDLDVQHLGPVRARVVGASAMGVHCAFEGLDQEAGNRVQGLVASVEEEYRPLITTARDGARRIEQAIEHAIASGRLTREQVFDVDYRPLPGTNPQQFETRYLAVFEEILPPIVEPLLISDNRMVFCLPIDRNGYIPVHNRKYALPQRAGDPAWNMANCRNKRVFDDRAGISAARSTRPFLVQSYMRDMGGGSMVMMREVDAPIRVQGRHWGGFRTAYRL